MTSDRTRTPGVHRAVPALTVWIYDTALGAVAGSARLRSFQKRDALEIYDAITISWLPGSHQPRIGHLWHTTSAAASAAASRDSVLGGLVGLIFLAPSTEDSAGAGLSALSQRLHGTGIDRTFMDEMRAQLHPESSALLVLSGEVDLDRLRQVVEHGLAPGDVVLMHAQLPPHAPDDLRDAVRELQGRSRGE